MGEKHAIMWILYNFYECENTDSETQVDNTIKNTNINWTPPDDIDHWLNQYITEIKSDIIKGLKKDFKMNISKNEGKALRQLLNDDSIVIRPADKESFGKRVPLVTKYSDALPNMYSILKKRTPTLHQSSRMVDIFPVAYRRDNNIRDILVHKKNMF